MAFTPSQRPTREWPLLVLALALVCAICIPLWQWSAGQRAEAGSKWTAERLGRLLIGFPQIASYGCFTWAAFILAGRYLEVRRQRRAFSFDLLNREVGSVILPEDARLLQRQVEQRAARGGPYILANMIRLALGKYATSRSGRDVSETVRTQADVDLGRLVSSMATVHYLAWAIPAIGFLGTVLGLAESFTWGGKTDKEVTVFIQGATEHLNFAFDCTLIALALSLVLMFFLHSVQREEEALVIDCQQYCLEHLVTRLYELDQEHARHGPSHEESPVNVHLPRR
jgi:biopolymer transport protein ExbB/TolQ